MKAIPLLAVLVFGCGLVRADPIVCGQGWNAGVSVAANWSNPGLFDSNASQSYASTGQPSSNCLTNPSLSVAGNGVAFNGADNYAFANGFVNLSTGSLGAAAGGVGLFGSGGGLSSAQATARLADTLFFAIAGASATTRTQIPFLVTLDGLEIGGPGSHEFQFTFGNCAFRQVVSPTSVLDQPPTCTQGSVSNSSRTSVTFSGYVILTGPNPSISTSLVLTVFGGAGKIQDFANTATLQLNLPPGVTFTSASGALLTGVGGAAVPEPGTLALGAAGLLALGIARRRGDSHTNGPGACGNRRRAYTGSLRSRRHGGGNVRYYRIAAALERRGSGCARAAHARRLRRTAAAGAIRVAARTPRPHAFRHGSGP